MFATLHLRHLPVDKLTKTKQGCEIDPRVRYRCPRCEAEAAESITTCGEAPGSNSSTGDSLKIVFLFLNHAERHVGGERL